MFNNTVFKFRNGLVLKINCFVNALIIVIIKRIKKLENIVVPEPN